MGCRRDEHGHRQGRLYEPYPRTGVLFDPSASLDPLAFCFFFLCFTVSCTFYIPLYFDIPFAFLSLIPACARSAAMRFVPLSRTFVYPLSFFSLSFLLFFSFLHLFDQCSHLHQALDKNIFADVSYCSSSSFFFSFAVLFHFLHFFKVSLCVLWVIRAEQLCCGSFVPVIQHSLSCSFPLFDINNSV